MADDLIPMDDETFDILTGEAQEAEEAAAEAVEQAEEAADAAEPVEEAADAVEQAEEIPGVLAEDLEVAQAKADAAVEGIAAEAAEEKAALEAAAESETTVEPEPENAPAPAKRERRSKQARAAKGEALAPEPAKKQGGLAALGVPAWLAIAACCLALGIAIGHFALGGGSAAAGSAIAGKTAIAEDQLDTPYASYTYNGATNNVTVREVIEQTSTLEASKNEDGTYKLPSAEYALSVARNAILRAECDSRGIEVSDEEAAAFAEDALGTSDFDSIASAYGMDAEQVKALIIENCRLNKLRGDVLGEELPEMPAAPEAAEEGKEDEATKEYAEYILNLVGDAWDAKAKAWADPEGSYATGLADYDLTAETQTYNAAQTAYYVAYQLYNTKQTELSTKWTDFVNGLMSAASIQVGTLIS